MPLANRITSSAIGLCCLGLANVGHAAVCDTLILDPGDQDVVIGELLYDWCIVIDNEEVCAWHYTGDLGVCVIEGGSRTIETPTCGDDWLAEDTFDLRTGDGDDRVSVLMASHTAGVPGLIDGVGMPCGIDWAIVPWPADFDFGITARLGVGEDAFYGSPNHDLVYSNTSGAGTADADFDLLCGRDGDDTLIGDRDDNKTHEEWLVGGNGQDVCEADPGIDGGDVYDGHATCDVVFDASALTAGEAKICVDTGNPLEW